MAKNANMIKAKKAKNDEFYTQLSDISSELTHQEYLDEFRGKWIYCNCDNPEISQFYRFFVLYFQQLGLKRLTCTYLAGTSGSKNPVAFRYDIYGDLNGNGVIDDGDIEITQLQGNGSFDSPECLQILQDCDVVVTNPPFSLFRPYLDLLMGYGKKFCIIANMNSIKYKETFKYIKNEEIWLGYNSPKEFILPTGDKRKFGNIIWWTNIDLKKCHTSLLLCKEYYGHEQDYPKYDNYDAIEVSKVVNIPKDYYGNMGVPITFLGGYNSEQFEIIGLYCDKRDIDPIFIKGSPYNLDINHKKFVGPVINGKATYDRILIKNKMMYLYWFLLIEKDEKLFIKIYSTKNPNIFKEDNEIIKYSDYFCFNKNIGNINNDKTNISLNIDQDNYEVTPDYLYKKFINFIDNDIQEFRNIKNHLNNGIDIFLFEDLVNSWEKFKNLENNNYNRIPGFFLTDKTFPKNK